MRTRADGGPQFELEPAGLRTASEDPCWDDTFGARSVNLPAYALALDGAGNLYAGGLFTIAGGIVANHIARWNGTSWAGLGSGMNASVLALALDGVGTLYAAGGFTAAGGASANHVARWDGTSWAALGSGLNDFVFALALDGAGNLYAGGQ